MSPKSNSWPAPFCRKLCENTFSVKATGFMQFPHAGRLQAMRGGRSAHNASAFLLQVQPAWNPSETEREHRFYRGWCPEMLQLITKTRLLLVLLLWMHLERKAFLPESNHLKYTEVGGGEEDRVVLVFVLFCFFFPILTAPAQFCYLQKVFK